MKMPSIMKRKKLQASTARRARALGLSDGMDYEQMSEPNMKLSRALLIVLVLHVGRRRHHRLQHNQDAREYDRDAPEAEEAVRPAAASIAIKELAAPSPNEDKVTDAPESKGPENDRATKPAIKTPAVSDSGKIYTVVKGDNRSRSRIT